MTVTVTKKGLTLFIVGTSKLEILNTITSEKHPKVKAMFYDVSGTTYHIIAEY